MDQRGKGLPEEAPKRMGQGERQKNMMFGFRVGSGCSGELVINQKGAVLPFCKPGGCSASEMSEWGNEWVNEWVREWHAQRGGCTTFLQGPFAGLLLSKRPHFIWCNTKLWLFVAITQCLSNLWWCPPPAHPGEKLDMVFLKWPD